MANTVPGLFARATAADPARPLLTWYDDGTGERIELSGTTLDNWLAKTANLLVDGAGLGPGDAVSVLLPPHWQTAAVLLGAWAAGLVVAGDAGPADAVFADLDRASGAHPGAADRYALGLAPLGAPLREVPAGFVDYIAEVRGQGDRFAAYPAVGPDQPAWRGPATATQSQLCAAAAGRATALGVGPGDRVLIDATAHPAPLDWLLAPLAAGASIVLCARLDPAQLAGRIASEAVNRILPVP